MEISPIASAASSAAPETSRTDEELRVSAQEFEAAFVRQMLQYAGMAEAFGADGGGSADALSSFLLDHLATEIAEQGAFGLADNFYEKLAAQQSAVNTTKGVRL